MSARIHETVLRVPCECLGIADPWQYADEHPEIFRWEGPLPRFQVAPTVRPFVDYVLSSRVTRLDSFGRTRGLTAREKDKYGPAFRSCFPAIDMDDVRLVDFAWYDGGEAPDYYR